MKKHPIPGKRCWDKRCRVCEANAKMLEWAINRANSMDAMEHTQ